MLFFGECAPPVEIKQKVNKYEKHTCERETKGRKHIIVFWNER